MSAFKAKMHQVRFPRGLRPRHRWESFQRSPGPLAVSKGLTSKGKEGEGEENGREKGREGLGKEEKGWPDCPLQLGTLDPAVE